MANCPLPQDSEEGWRLCTVKFVLKRHGACASRIFRHGVWWYSFKFTPLGRSMDFLAMTSMYFQFPIGAFFSSRATFGTAFPHEWDTANPQQQWHSLCSTLVACVEKKKTRYAAAKVACVLIIIIGRGVGKFIRSCPIFVRRLVVGFVRRPFDPSSALWEGCRRRRLRDK